MRRLIKNLRPRRTLDRLQRRPPLPALRRKKSAEAKRIRRQPARHQRRQKCRRPRNRHHRHPMPNRQRNQPIPRIRNSRHARIGHQRDARALLHLFDQFRRLRHLIVLVIAGGTRRDRIMIEQFLRLPRVLASNHIHFLQHAYRPQRDVLQIPDRRPHQIKRGPRDARYFSRGGGLVRIVAEVTHARSLSPSRPPFRWLLRNDSLRKCRKKAGQHEN